jgi:hypothetical protein
MSRTAWSRARLCTALAVISVGASAGLGLLTVSVFTHAAPGAAAAGSATVHQGSKSPAQAEQAGPGWTGSIVAMTCGVDGGKDGRNC